MEPSRIADKLDQIGEADLGLTLDQTQLWEKLDSRLSSKTRLGSFIMVAASIAFLILLLPLGLQKTEVPTDVLVEETAPEMISQPPIIEKEKTALVASVSPSKEEPSFLTITRKGSTPTLAIVPDINQLVNAEFVSVPKSKPSIENSFDNNDIAIIQSSLEESGQRGDKKLKIKATWHFYTSAAEEPENQN